MPSPSSAEKGKTKKKKGKVKFKKSPQAPRRFKSAYMFFSTAKHPEIRARHKEEGKLGEKTTTIAKLVSQEWKNQSREEREKWEEMARKDKMRYEVEKSMYTGPWKVPAKKRTQKDPDAPKRPMSAFLSFSNEKRTQAREENPNRSNADISRILAKMWKEASEEKRNVHIEKEFKLRQEYKIAIAKWRAKTSKEAAAKREQREEAALEAAARARDNEEQGMPGPPAARGSPPSAGAAYAEETMPASYYGGGDGGSYASPNPRTGGFSSAYGAAAGGYPYASQSQYDYAYDDGAAGTWDNAYGDASSGTAYPYYQLAYGGSNAAAVGPYDGAMGYNSRSAVAGVRGGSPRKYGASGVEMPYNSPYAGQGEEWLSAAAYAVLPSAGAVDEASYAEYADYYNRHQQEYGGSQVAQYLGVGPESLAAVPPHHRPAAHK